MSRTPIPKSRRAERQLVALMLQARRLSTHSSGLPRARKQAKKEMRRDHPTARDKRKLARTMNQLPAAKDRVWLFRGDLKNTRKRRLAAQADAEEDWGYGPGKTNTGKPWVSTPNYWSPNPRVAKWYATIGDEGVTPRKRRVAGKPAITVRKKMGGTVTLARPRWSTIDSYPDEAMGFTRGLFRELSQAGHPVMSEITITRQRGQLPMRHIKVQKAWLGKRHGNQSFDRRIQREVSGDATKLRNLARYKNTNPAVYRRLRKAWITRKQKYGKAGSR